MAQRTVTVTLVANIGSFVSSMARAGSATAGFGALSAKYLGAAGIVGGFAAAIGAASDFESAMSGVKAATMASADTLGRLREAALQAGADTQYSATEAANAIREMAKAGVSAEDIMGGGLAGALSLAAAGQMEVAQAAEIASVAMTQFGLAGEDLPHVADLLAAGAGKAMGEVSDLGAALNQAGLVASSAGLSIEETTGTLAAFASAGLVGSDAGTSFRSMLQHLQNPSKEAAATMADLGISMYDANGQFVGMESLAGQLQAGMSNLTPAARDAAMAVMFGSDAVRAANVLYSQGAAGIANWTAAVDDSGYAAEQAAILNDNLAGDLERLGGAFDSLMIEMGSGSQGPLRSLVQGLTGIVGVVGDVITWFSDLPTPVMAGVGALTAVILLKGPFTAAMALMGGGLSGLMGRAIAATSSMAAFRAVAGSALAFMGGPIGLAIVGVSVGLGFLADAFWSTEEATVDATGAQEGFKAALEASNGAIDDNVRVAAAKAAQDAGLLDVAEKAGVSLTTVTEALLGNAGAYETVSVALEAYKNNRLIAAGFEERGEDTLKNESEAADAAMTAFLQLAGVLPATKAEQEQLALATGQTADATAGATEATGAFQRQMESTQAYVDSARQAIDNFKLSLDVLTGAHVSMIEVESAFQAALAEADGALEELNGSVLDGAGNLNLQSEAGRAAADVLLGVRDSGNLLISTMIQQGATSEQVQAKDAQLRESFIQTAGQMGIERGAAEALADQILGIPAERQTQVDIAGAEQARVNLQMVKDAIEGIPLFRTTTVTTYYQTVGTPPVAGSSIRSTVNAIGGIVHAFADGGFMPGGIAKIVPPNTWRVIGDRVRDDEAYIPINNDARSHAILQTTAERMGYMLGREVSGSSMRGREFSGGGMGGQTVTAAAPNLIGLTIQGRVTVDGDGIATIAGRVVDQRDRAQKRNTRSYQ